MNYHAYMPLDMGQFNTVTEGKSTYQEELLELFFQNSAECISLMEIHMNGDKWREAADELRSISSNIGALELAKVCAVAERMGAATSNEKKKILENIRSNIQRLRAFVRNTRYS